MISRGRPSPSSVEDHPRAGPGAPRSGDPFGCGCGVALEARHGLAYNEEAFHYFLAIERRRADRSETPFLLILVDLPTPEGRAPIGPLLARQLFRGLSRAAGETDFIGWYRHGRIAGAVLVEVSDGAREELDCLVGQRALSALRQCLPPAAARRLQLRVYRHAPRERNDPARPWAAPKLILGEL
jgi:hypothetical protein